MSICTQALVSIAKVTRLLMRVLLLAQFFPPDLGGEERHVFNLANTLAERGHEVAVATQRIAGVPDEEVLLTGVRVHRFETLAMHLPGVYSTSRPHHLPVPDPLGVRELARIVRRERPNVIHAHNWIINSALALRRRSVARPPYGLVLTLHDFSQVCATKRLMRGQGLRGSRGRTLPALCDLPLRLHRRSNHCGRHRSDAPLEKPGHRPRRQR